MDSASAPATCHLPCRSPTCPPWLQAAIADIEQRVRALAVTFQDDEAAGGGGSHSFAERAENYYQKRPQLLALLTDLHHRYLYLADRYSQSLLKSHYPIPLDASTTHSDSDADDRSSDAESSLSFQPPTAIAAVVAAATFPDVDLLLAELVSAWVNRDILADEAERRRSESARKIELQGSLLEVLESERLVLLGENARLGFRASAAEEEAAAAAAELGYMRRRAAEMARLVVKLREEHRVCMLGRKIERLQTQIYGLEMRNRECFEAMAAWEAEKKVGAAEVERLRAENCRLAAEAAAMARRKRVGVERWWARVRMVEWAPCMPPPVRKVEEEVKGKGKGKEMKYSGCFCL